MVSMLYLIKTPWLIIFVIWLGVERIPDLVWCQRAGDIDRNRPCEHRQAIDLPNARQCLVPFSSAYNWTKAQSLCRLDRGTLYETPSVLQFSNQELLNCLTSMSEPTLTDLWVNSVDQWSPQFAWVNNTVMNKIVYCTQKKPHWRNDKDLKKSISLDYCVLSCSESEAGYVVIYVNTVQDKTKTYCYCVFQLADEFKVPCDTDTFSYNNFTHYFIARTDEKPLIQVTQGSDKEEFLCATINNQTYESRQLKSRVCADRQPFICNLRDSLECPNKVCIQRPCVFSWRGDCLRRVDYPLSWYEARAFCNRTLGGDLWHMESVDDLKELNSNLVGKTTYWTGASNFRLIMKANSASLERYGSNYQRVRCGHFEKIEELNRWQWSSTACDQAKAYLCQFEKESFDNEEMGRDVVCPWPTPVTSRPIIIPDPVVIVNKTEDDDAFPIAALISGLVAGLILLTCLAVSCAYCCRRRWLFRGYSKKDQVSFVPYVTEPSDPVFIANGHEMENMSYAGRIRSTSSLSENGSQHGMVKALPYYNTGFSQSAMSESYGTNNGAQYSSKSLDRNQLATKNKNGMDVNSSFDDKVFASPYSTMPIKPRDYMILEGQMNIQEDALLRGSVRGKPEVTLVTDHVDMNFTVNHAAPHGHPGSDRSSLERTLEEIHLPVSEGNMTLTVPERVVEARSMSTSSMTKY